MPLARASELDRLLACPGSAVLPRSEEKSERATEAAAWGTYCHLWKETGEIRPGKYAGTLKKKVDLLGVGGREELWAGGLHEVALAYNVVSGAAGALILPATSDEAAAWKSSFGDSWVVGTADYVGLLLESPWVDDLKTGRHAEWETYKFQQAFYALAWSTIHFGEFREARSTITHWPKYPITKKPLRFGTVLTLDFMDDFKRRLRQLREDVLRLRELDQERVVVRLSDGPQCLYCPSRLSCIKGQKYDV